LRRKSEPVGEQVFFLYSNFVAGSMGFVAHRSRIALTVLSPFFINFATDNQDGIAIRVFDLLAVFNAEESEQDDGENGTKGMDYPCLERRSETFLRHRTKWERDEIGNMETSVKVKRRRNQLDSPSDTLKKEGMYVKKEKKSKILVSRLALTHPGKALHVEKSSPFAKMAT
jgi:hypothetical protein